MGTKKVLLRSGLVLAALGVAVGAYFLCRGGLHAEKPDATVPEVAIDTANVTAEAAFAGFRGSFWGRQFHDFERWSLVISERRFLAGMKRDEIEAVLGKPSFVRWTTVNKALAESEHIEATLLQVFARKATACFYVVDEDERTHSGLRRAMVLVYADRDRRLLRSYYHRTNETQMDVALDKRVDYTVESAPPFTATSQADTQKATDEWNPTP